MIVKFDTVPDSKILDAGDILMLSNLQKPWTTVCKDVNRTFELEYSTYHILNRSELCECSLMASNNYSVRPHPTVEACQKQKMASSYHTMPSTG